MKTLPETTRPARVFELFDDFAHYTDGDDWTLTATDSGTAAVGDAVGGVLTINASDGTAADNDESYFHTTHELFKFAADKPIRIEARIKFSEANDDDANVMFGLMSAVAANALVDDAGGPKASYSGAVFYKVDGETFWRIESSVGATKKSEPLLDETAGGGVWQELQIDIHPTTIAGIARARVEFSINGVVKVVHSDVAIASATEMAVVFGVKNGSANAESLLIDRVHCRQLR